MSAILLVVVAVGAFFYRFVSEACYAAIGTLCGVRVSRCIVGIGPRVAGIGRLEIRGAPIWVRVQLEVDYERRARALLPILASLGGIYASMTLTLFVLTWGLSNPRPEVRRSLSTCSRGRPQKRLASAPATGSSKWKDGP